MDKFYFNSVFFIFFSIYSHSQNTPNDVERIILKGNEIQLSA